MKVSNRGLNLIMEFEGFSGKAYPDPGSKNGEPWTIGWGTTVVDGVRVKKGDTINKTKARELLQLHVNEDYAPEVEASLNGIDLNQNEFDALVSLVYNIGIKAFNKSTVKRMLVKGDRVAAANAFGMWIKNDGKVLAGLVRRRAAEKALFLTPLKKDPLEAPRKPVQSDSKPESSLTPQMTDKPLVTSREIAGGVVLGTSGISQFISAVDVNDLVTTKQGIQELKTQTVETQNDIVFSNYIIQGASILIFIVGVFIIWKRFMDRKEGKR